jgi:DtxR family Mn-dependent transcriptional regulator
MPEPLFALLIAATITTVGYLVMRPEKGLLSQWRQARELNERVRGEDVLKYVHKREMKGRRPTLESIAGVLNLSLNDTTQLLTRIQSAGFLWFEHDEIRLTPKGRDSALHIIRAHRLWERYLAEETGFEQADWHGKAERYEHLMTPSDANALSARLGHPTHDPHGDPIPSASGEVVDHGGQPLTALPIDILAQIVHLEDEPDVVYAQLAAEGLYPGMTVRVLESSPGRLRFWADGDEHLLAPIMASNISVRPLHVEAGQPMEEPDSLAMLALGETAEVVRISEACRGAERRRFLDLGIVPGTEIRAEIRSPSGDPTAYNIRGALIALRREQALFIHTKKSKVQA